METTRIIETVKAPDGTLLQIEHRRYPILKVRPATERQVGAFDAAFNQPLMIIADDEMPTGQMSVRLPSGRAQHETIMRHHARFPEEWSIQSGINGFALVREPTVEVSRLAPEALHLNDVMARPQAQRGGVMGLRA